MRRHTKRTNMTNNDPIYRLKKSKKSKRAPKLALLGVLSLLVLGLVFYYNLKEVRVHVEVQPLMAVSGRPLEGKTIVIDPGHGGKHPGSIGQLGTFERDVTLQMAKEMEQELLEKTGATVLLTRNQDETVDLQQRVDIAAEARADLFLSIHFDAFTTNDVEGMTTYHKDSHDQPIAQAVHDRLMEKDFDTRDRGVRVGDYYVLRENTVPALLLELGYISNEKDERRMRSLDFHKEASEAIVEGMIDYFRER
ncbi:N-acetylmuramoyl-L-alanine amidase family protein [Paenibacillus assamensis]|uniref:N-acetylmuramoyl-L-alanine amidase family protein n=1 Tax=Paenibacillus assamensis TaxID=311244 RepID=UPI00040734BA|nr:N-acetylmuramoyl-L-alanine amidase [Paenibacillus assamensis]